MGNIFERLGLQIGNRRNRKRIPFSALQWSKSTKKEPKNYSSALCGRRMFITQRLKDWRLEKNLNRFPPKQLKKEKETLRFLSVFKRTFTAAAVFIRGTLKCFFGSLKCSLGCYSETVDCT